MCDSLLDKYHPMKKILPFLLLSLSSTLFGQTSFNYQSDFKTILSKTKDSNDNLYYDKLLKRFAMNDTSLTDYEVLALLIGFTDKKEFKPYQDITIEKEIFSLNGNGKFKEALDSANVFLKTHPLSVKVLFEKGYSFYKLGQNDSADYYAYKGKRIFRAMYFSGKGKSPETPTFALGPADGQDYIYKFVGSAIGGAKIGTMGSGRDNDGNFLDILQVVPESGSPSFTLYFIIQHATDKMFSEEDKASMEEALKEMDTKKQKSKK